MSLQSSPGAGPPALQAATSDPMLGAFHALIDRLESVIAAETEALTRHQPVDVGAVNRQKRQGLLELTRLMRAMPPTLPQEEARGRLVRLTAALERNQAILEVQLQAVRGIADIVSRLMRDAESDGTYSLRAGWQ